MLAHAQAQQRARDLTSVPFATAAPYVAVEMDEDVWGVAGPDGGAVPAPSFPAEELAQTLASLLNAAWRAGFLAVFDPLIPAVWKRDALRRDGDEPHVHQSRPDTLCHCPYGRDAL